MLRVVTPYKGNPLFKIEDLKIHLREEETETSNDDYIAGLAETALELIETDVQRVYAPRTLAWVRTGFQGRLRLPFAADSIEVLSIAYTDPAGEVRTVDPASYFVTMSGRTKEVRLRSGYGWPSVGEGAEPVAITFKAGAEVIPRLVCHAVKLLVGHLYDNREAVVANATNMGELPMGVEALISAERWS